MAEFCHIAPTGHLDLVGERHTHLVLAHLVEEDQRYVDFYIEQKQRNNCTIILDNSAFEMYKRGLPMYPSDKLIAMGNKINADYIVMTDYPGEPGEKTIESCKTLAPQLKEANFKTFFVPQSEIGNLDDCLRSFIWARENSHLVDYVGISILTAPNVYGVEKNNKLQRFNSRLRLMYQLNEGGLLSQLKYRGCKIHFLGMVDGPNEILFMNPFKRYIDTWDSSAGVWAGLNDIEFDKTPTGLINGKFEKEVDFNFVTTDNQLINKAKHNIDYIDRLVYGYL